MIVYSLVIITLFFAVLSMRGIWRGIRKPLPEGWHQALASVALATTVYLYGTWFFLSVYLKYVFGFAAILVLLAGLATKKRTAPKRSGARLFFNMAFTALFTILSVLYFTGTTGKPEKVQIAFPLKTGKYLIMQGGKGLPANLFHYSYRGAVYAIDLVKLNDNGNRASHIFSSHLEDYAIFNDTVFSPCSGTVLRIENDNPDNIPPDRRRGPTNTNMIVIETDSFTVFMAHLRQGSVMVKPGDKVTQEQPLARVGNSGFTLEPHLHIQVHKNTHTGLPWYSEEPLYISFDGRSYLLFETITPRRVDMVEK